MSNAHSADADWLSPDPSPASVPPPADRSGVFRVEAQGDAVQRYRTLRDAIVEPPRDPEGEIRGMGGCLAQAAPDDQPCAWVLTALGRERIEIEIRHEGEAAQ